LASHRKFIKDGWLSVTGIKTAPKKISAASAHLRSISYIFDPTRKDKVRSAQPSFLDE
jgi:hypothetical protein